MHVVKDKRKNKNQNKNTKHSISLHRETFVYENRFSYMTWLRLFFGLVNNISLDKKSRNFQRWTFV